ncbi:transketolase family protein [Pseudolactococcus reticulitermitis]|uniref:Transketolase-like pyrimidine-binding domain-containing protein n=1 Tax=Pseudolactococcus reticulitermitis TaxID=2025039 RepID=A0A224X9M7_9LACT|nr:serine hydroxymethyltransferase [Lactococcus reticulitermitis]GAX46884.1 hypothetical protein RsY01_464 [Lactococcus reticulitermitis]
MRTTVIEKLIDLENRNGNIVLLTGDVGSSTLSYKFGEKFPEKYFNIGISEANIVSIAAGVNYVGFIPVVCLFSKHLVLRALEQINDSLLLNKRKAILIGEYAGFSSSFEGASHQLLNDISIMSSFPDIELYCPYDKNSIKESIEEAALSERTSYIRINKNDLISNVMDRSLLGENSRIIISTGYIGALISKDYEMDNDINSKVDLILVNKVKPLDYAQYESIIFKYDHIYIIEENSKIGGLASQLKSLFYNSESNNLKITSFGVGECFGDTGTYEFLLKKNQLSSTEIFNEIRKSF